MAVHASNNPFSCANAQVDGEALDNLIEETVAEQGNQAYTQKGGYPGTTAGLKQELEDQINSLSFEGVQSYDTLVDLQAITPIPVNGTTAKVAKDTAYPENNGNWYVSGGAWVQFDNVVENVVEESNTSKGVTGQAVVKELEPYINDKTYLTKIDKAEDFFVTFNGVDSEINLNTPITLSDDGDSLEVEFYASDFGVDTPSSISLGFIGQVGISNSVMGYNQEARLYVRDNAGNWLNFNATSTVAEVDKVYNIKLVWGASDISVYLDGVFKKTITKGDFTIANIGHSYNYFLGGVGYLKITKGATITEVDNVLLLDDISVIKSTISRKPNTVLKIGENFAGDNNTDAVSAKQVLDNTIGKGYLIETFNLLDYNLFSNGYFSGGGTWATDNNFLTARNVPCLPNTEYTFSGFTTAGGPRVAYLDEFKTWISNSVSNDTGNFTFTTPNNCYFLGLKVAQATGQFANPLDNIYVDTAMLNLGSMALPFQPFEPLINGAKVKFEFDTNDNINSYNYYEFNTTANAGHPQFRVYTNIGGSKYIGFKLALQYDLSDSVYSNQWRIHSAEMYTFNGSAMISDGVNLLYGGESEFTYRIWGASDHTGGIHGDEILNSVNFFADGKEVSIATNIALTQCKEFYYIQDSNLYETDNVAHPIQSLHYKVTNFKDGGYHTKNRIKLELDCDFEQIFFGISCVAKSCASKGHNELNDGGDFTGSLNDIINYKLSRDFYARNEANNLSAFTTSKLSNPIVNDFNCQMFVTDRQFDSKYYRKYVPAGITPAGTILEGEQSTYFKYNG